MLTLGAPSIDPAISRTVDTRPKSVSAWLGRLPFASPTESAQQLITALYALNRSPLDETARYTLMQLYRPVVARVGANLEAPLAGSGVPPRAQQRQLGGLLRELQIEHSSATNTCCWRRPSLAPAGSTPGFLPKSLHG